MRSSPFFVVGVAMLPFLVDACGSNGARRQVTPRDSGADETDGGSGGRSGSGGAGTGGVRITGGATGTGGAGETGGGAGSGGTEPIRDASVDGDVPDATTVVDASADTGASTDSDAGGNAGDSGATYVPEPGCLGPVNEAPITPAEASLPSTGLVLWLRGDRGVYKTTTNAVCAWLDQSGRRAVFAAGPTRPTWAETGINSRSSVHFGPANSYVGTAGVLGLAVQQARTFVAVQRITNTTARFQAVNMGDFTTPGTYVMIDTNTFQTGGSREGVYATNNSYDSTLATSTSPRLHVLSLDAMTVGNPVLPSIHYRVNGTELSLTRRAGTGNFQSFASANFTAIGTGTSTVDVAEILAYDHALTAPELTALEAALTARYQLN